jgi:hypothetical protein
MHPGRRRSDNLPAPRVLCDAAYRDGRAVLAVVGALGEQTKAVRAESAGDAEAQAVLFGMALALGRWPEVVPTLRFYTDCMALVDRRVGSPDKGRRNIAALLLRYPQWSLTWVPRREVREAHRLASSRLRSNELVIPALTDAERNSADRGGPHGR